MITAEDYYSYDALSASDVKTILKYGIDYYYALKRGDVAYEKTEALIFGAYFHSLILKPQDLIHYAVVDKRAVGESQNQKSFLASVLSGETIETAYVCSYSTEGKSKARISEEAFALYERFKPTIEALKYGKKTVSEESVRKAEEMKKSLLSYLEKSNDGVFKRIYDSPLSYIETPMTGRFFGLDVKGMPDAYLVENSVVYLSDLKSIDNSGLKSCIKNVEEYKYKLSMYWYLWLIAQNHGFDLEDDGVKIRCSLMFVSKNYPYNCTEVELAPKNIKLYLKRYLLPIKRIFSDPYKPIKVKI